MTDTIERRGGLRVHAPRLARCGHMAPYMGGVQLAQCDACKWPARSCAFCAADITRSRRNRIYCSQHCGFMASGVVRIGPRLERVCALPDCNDTFSNWSTRIRCCSEAHGKRLWKLEAPAKGYVEVRPWDDRRRDNYQRRRALLKGGRNGDPVILAEIVARDRSVCGICRERVDLALEWPDPLSKSIDHIVPVSRGGAHDPSNCQLAHLRCNISKGARVA